MPLEGPITDISDLNPTWPVDADQHEITDDNLRKCKDAAKKSFLSLGTDGGVVTISAAEFNAMQGVTSNVQQQLNGKLPSWIYTTEQFNLPAPGDNLLVQVTSGLGSLWGVYLPVSPANGSQIIAKHYNTAGLVIGTDYTFAILRQGTNTITDLNAGIAGAQVIQASSEFLTWYCVYFSSVWYCWPLEGG